MLTRQHLSVALFLTAALLLGACAGAASTSDPYDEEQSRVYQGAYKRVVEMAAEAAVDTGLEIEDSGVQSATTYVINAIRKERLSGSSEPLQVARIEIYLDKLKDEAVRIRINQEKITRTSTVGTSSAMQRDYARRIFRRLDEKLQQV